MDVPLITPISKKYFDKALRTENETYYRTLDIRLCLENICDELIIELVSAEDKLKWEKYSLHKKLECAKTFMDNDIIDNLISAKKIGNKGIHEGEEANIDNIDIEQSAMHIVNFSLEIFVSHFKKYGFETREVRWIPTVFSTLPPMYRIAILEKYHQTSKSVFVIDKLAMAYLKNFQEKEAREFLKKCFQNKEIDDYMYTNLEEKLTFLQESFDRNIERFSIARTLEESKENFNRLLPSIDEKDRGGFIVLVSLILNGNKEI